MMEYQINIIETITTCTPATVNYDGDIHQLLNSVTNETQNSDDMATAFHELGATLSNYDPTIHTSNITEWQTEKITISTPFTSQELTTLYKESSLDNIIHVVSGLYDGTITLYQTMSDLTKAYENPTPEECDNHVIALPTGRAVWID